MKSTNYLAPVALLVTLLTYSGCSDKAAPPVSVKDTQLKALSKTWKCTAATLQSTAQPVYVPNFTLTISGTPGNATFGYTTTGRPPGLKSSPWPASGTFTFGTDPSTQINRDDLTPPPNSVPLPVTYSVSSTQLQLTFQYGGPGFDGRTGAVTGQWVFTFGL